MYTFVSEIHSFARNHEEMEIHAIIMLIYKAIIYTNFEHCNRNSMNYSNNILPGAFLNTEISSTYFSSHFIAI